MRFSLSRSFSFWVLCCLVVRCAGEQSSASVTATVQIRINTAYDDSPESLLLLSTIARYAPLQRVPVLAGDSLDGIFVRAYGFGKGDLPKTYAILLPIILEKNHVTRAQELLAGFMVMPSIPKRAWMRWGRAYLSNYIANMYALSADAAVPASSAANRKPRAFAGDVAETAASQVAFTAVRPVDQTRPTAPFAVVSMELRVREAVELAESRLLPPGALTIGTHPMPVKLADENKCDTEPASQDHLTLTPDQKTEIAQLLRQGSHRSPVLFILDTGWPSLSAY